MSILLTVHVVQHAHEAADGSEDIKVIGVYRSRREAEAAVDRLRLQPGFCDHPDGFHIDEYLVGKDHWTEGFSSPDEAAGEPPTVH